MQPSLRTTRALTRAAGAFALIVISGCTDVPTTPTRIPATPDMARLGGAPNEPAPPGGLVTVSFGGGSLTLWPYTAEDFGQQIDDPINALFAGYADPLRIRAALRRLNGNRTAFGFPAGAPFDCTWRDAVGNEQTAFATPEEWTGSAIQLQCGEYAPLRFHVRLFGEGPWTLAGTHLDLNIPGTHEHQAISWEVAEQFLAVDLIRSGLLAPGSPSLSAPITPAPSFKEIPAVVYNGMPVSLRALIGGPLGNVVSAVPVPNDGRARLFVLDKPEPIVADVSEQEFTLQFNQTIPKPICAGPADLVRVTGPLYYRSIARVTPGGIYERMYSVRGDLNVVAVDAVTGQLGPVQLAKISQEHEGSITPAGALARFSFTQRLFKTDGAPGDVQTVTLHAGTRGHDEYRLVETCGR